MSLTGYETLKVYQLSVELADRLWTIVDSWGNFAKSSVGIQLVKAADSVGANIAEGTGRGSIAENKRFAKIARGSLFETKHWVRRAVQRDLIAGDEANALEMVVGGLIPRLSAYINSIGREKNFG